MKNYPVFNFDIDKILEYCKENIYSNRERVTYLNYVLKEKKNEGSFVMELEYLQPGSFFRTISNEKEFFKSEMEVDSKLIEEKTNGTYRDKKMEKLPKINIEKIRWLGTNTQLAYLIKWLKDNFFPEESHHWIWANNCFLDKNGEPFKENALPQAHANYEQRYEKGPTPGIKKLMPLIEKLPEIKEEE